MLNQTNAIDSNNSWRDSEHKACESVTKFLKPLADNGVMFMVDTTTIRNIRSFTQSDRSHMLQWYHIMQL